MSALTATRQLRGPQLGDQFWRFTLQYTSVSTLSVVSTLLHAVCHFTSTCCLHLSTSTCTCTCVYHTIPTDCPVHRSMHHYHRECGPHAMSTMQTVSSPHLPACCGHGVHVGSCSKSSTQAGSPGGWPVLWGAALAARLAMPSSWELCLLSANPESLFLHPAPWLSLQLPVLPVCPVAKHLLVARHHRASGSPQQGEL